MGYRICRQCGGETADDDGFCSDSCMHQYDAELTGADQGTSASPMAALGSTQATTTGGAMASKTAEKSTKRAGGTKKTTTKKAAGKVSRAKTGTRKRASKKAAE